MAQGYYTLQEAAQVLGMSPEELKQRAQKNQIRSFQDRGTWRFRVQDIQELARQRGAASDMELLLGEGKAPRAHDSPAPKSKSPKSPSRKDSGPRTPSQAPDVFDFSLDLGEDSVEVGREILADRPVVPGKPDSKKGGPPTPPGQKSGSDSDVRLVSDGSDMDFVFDGPNRGMTSLGSDSDVRLVPQPGEASPAPPSGRTPKAAPQKKSGLAPESPVPKKAPQPAPVEQQDSPVRLVPMDSDSDVKIVGAGADEVALGQLSDKTATDSDIRLESAGAGPPPPSSSDEGLLTEEINLDEELHKQETLSRKKPQAKVKPKSKLPKFTATSPFELSSDSGINLSPPKPAAPASPKPDSSDFDLTPAGKKSDKDSSDDFSLELPADSDFSLDLAGSGEGELKGPTSGISLDHPVDSGISLEQGGEGSDEIEFELSLDAQATPKPAPAGQPAAQSSEFELSLDDSQAPGLEPASDSSEFELTLDDSGSLSALEEDAPQVKAGQDKDIFDTDFDVPALEEESGSQVAALETDLDSSDFDLALADSDIAAEEESGSQVVGLDEEEADQGAATVGARRHRAGAALIAEEDLGFEQLPKEEAEAEVEEEAEEEPARAAVRETFVKPAPWGAVPVLVMLPCVLVMFLVGLMGFELVQHITGYKPTGFLTKTIGELVGQKIK